MKNISKKYKMVILSAKEPILVLLEKVLNLMHLKKIVSEK